MCYLGKANHHPQKKLIPREAVIGVLCLVLCALFLCYCLIIMPNCYLEVDNRREFNTTKTLEILMAAAANIGFNIPTAANGTINTL